VLADDGEQVAQQGPVVRGQVLGDLVDRRRRTVRILGSDLDVATAIERLAPAFVGR
jgi:hypothetical protein